MIEISSKSALVSSINSENFFIVLIEKITLLKIKFFLTKRKSFNPEIERIKVLLDFRIFYDVALSK